MNQPIYNFFTNDHRRVEAILEEATINPDKVNMELYEQFRIALLTHIKMEEKILFVAAQKANNNIPLPIQAQLRLEHGAITTLMVPSPTRELVKVLQYVLDKHDIAEEEPGGMYDACEALTKTQTQEILTELAQVTPVPMRPHNDAPIAMDSVRRSLIRAGYDYDEILKLEES